MGFIKFTQGKLKALRTNAEPFTHHSKVIFLDY